ncbi:MAG: hypothetical protein ACJA2O_004566 [Candidatus Azotimanducaceae bacterium]
MDYLVSCARNALEIISNSDAPTTIQTTQLWLHW